MTNCWCHCLTHGLWVQLRNGRKFVTLCKIRTSTFFFSQTWLTAKGDETKCADMCPAGYSAKSFPRLSRGGGLAVIYHSSLQRYISVDATIDFDHTVFELLHLKLSVSQCAIHFLCLYRPPPSKKNRLSLCSLISSQTR